MSDAHSIKCLDCGKPISRQGERCKSCASKLRWQMFGESQKADIGRRIGDKLRRAGGKVRGKPTPEFRVWTAIKTRCYNPNFKDFYRYGGRGIIVCERWLHSFQNFLADMGPRPSAKHSIDRFPDNDGNYEPGNCRWATGKEQSRNRRSNRILAHNGESLTIVEWSERTGVPHDTLIARIEAGWDIETAMSKPVKKQRRGELLEAFGEKKTLAEWGRDERCVVWVSALAYRINQCGWSPEKAIATEAMSYQDRGRSRFKKRMACR